MSIVLDTNVAVYAFSPTDTAKQHVAKRLLDHAITARSVVPRQVLGEILSAGHRKPHISLADARLVVGLLEKAADVIDTDGSVTLAASELAERHRLQYFDAVICTIARRSGASILFSEDMHDGLRLGTMTIVDPFKEHNHKLVEAALSS